MVRTDAKYASASAFVRSFSAAAAALSDTASAACPTLSRPVTCRGAWARLTVDQFKRLALRKFYGHMIYLLIYYQHSFREL